MATEEFREALKEPYQHLQRAERLLENETNENLPEGQLRAQVSIKTSIYCFRLLVYRKRHGFKEYEG